MRQLNELKDKESFSTKKILKSNKLLTTVLAFVLVAGMASPAFALNIDTFNVGDTDLTADDGTNHTPMATQTLGGLDVNQVLGGERITSIDLR